MAENCEVENKLLRRIIGKLVHLIEVEEDAIGLGLNDEWQKPVFEEAKLYADQFRYTQGDVMSTETENLVKAREYIRELEAKLSKARECAAHNLDRCGEQRKQNAALREALGAADSELKDAIDYHNAAEDTHANDTRELLVYIKKTRALIEAALKGV